VLVQPVPHGDGVVRSPADDEHNHNRDGHLERALLGPAEHVIVGTPESLGDHVLEDALALPIDLQVNGSVAVDEHDQRKGVHAAHGGRLIQLLIKVAPERVEDDALKVAGDGGMLLQMEEKGLPEMGETIKYLSLVENNLFK